MKAICFFNNKGGVGKTTLTANIAYHFATTLGQRVCVIDCDPQCNVTQLILGDRTVEELYWKPRTSNKVTTVLDVVGPILDGDASISDRFIPVSRSDNRFQVDVLPGHPKFSVIEDRLSDAWAKSVAGEIGGIRTSNWCYAFCVDRLSDYDFVFMDIGPSLGSLNRSVLIGADYFVTPLGADVFSLLGVRNIGEWIRAWLRTYEIGLENSASRFPGRIEEYRVRRDIPISVGYAGYTLQQYITKSKQGVRRATLAFEAILKEVPKEINRSLKGYLAYNVDAKRAHLGDVPNMYSLIPLAQTVNAPIAELASSDGLVGSQFKQSFEYGNIHKALALRIAENVGISARR